LCNNLTLRWCHLLKVQNLPNQNPGYANVIHVFTRPTMHFSLKTSALKTKTACFNDVESLNVCWRYAGVLSTWCVVNERRATHLIHTDGQPSHYSFSKCKPSSTILVLFSRLGYVADQAIYFANVFFHFYFFNGRLSRPGSSEPNESIFTKISGLVDGCMFTSLTFFGFSRDVAMAIN